MCKTTYFLNGQVGGQLVNFANHRHLATVSTSC